MPEPNQEHLRCQFTAVNVPITTKPEDGEKKRRTFEAEVYSGGRIDNHHYWGRTGVVIDLQGLQLKEKTGLVEEHFGGKRVGVATSYEITNGFKAKGHFLSNAKAQEIVQDLDEEYPFQMSWWAAPESIEEIAPGKTVFVNGQEFTGPLHVFRNVRVHEITICGVGADTQTTIEAFSAKNQNQTEDTDVTELEQTKQALKQAEQERDAARNELQQFKATKRTEDIEALAADLKTQFSAEDKTMYQNMDDATFAFAAKNMRQFSSKPSDQQQTPQKQGLPSYLTQHQAGGDQGQQQFNGGGQDQHRFAAGIQKLQEMNKAGK